MEQISIAKEINSLVSKVATTTSNYSLFNDLIIDASGNALALLTDKVIYAGYLPYQNKRLIEIEVLRKVSPVKVLMVPNAILDEDAIIDESLVDIEWRAQFIHLKKLFDKTDHKKKALHHIIALYQAYVVYYMHLGKGTPPLSKEYINTEINISELEQIVESRDKADLAKRNHDMVEYDLPRWRNLERMEITNETGFLYLRKRSLTDIETSDGVIVQVAEIKRLWKFFKEHPDGATDIRGVWHNGHDKPMDGYIKVYKIGEELFSVGCTKLTLEELKLNFDFIK